MGNWVAFGDDASVAAGLALATVQDGNPPVFCGDAIADPLTGLHAALAALAFHRGGQSSLLDLSLKNVTAHTLFQENFAAEQRGDTGEGEVLKNRGRWEVRWGSQSAPVLPPHARKPHGQARELGADTEDVLEEFEISC
jgi:crotonobetainyl-CoA:carnitine CoA-transferase CaiB-like acyl-CoA transferase